VHPADVLFPGSAPPAALAVRGHDSGSGTPIRKSLARQAADSRFARPGARIHDAGHRHWRRLLHRACAAGAPIRGDAPAAVFPPDRPRG
jgi:hypothetical protein